MDVVIGQQYLLPDGGLVEVVADCTSFSGCVICRIAPSAGDLELDYHVGGTYHFRRQADWRPVPVSLLMEEGL